MQAGAGRISRKRPSGAMVVAIGAVVLAVVGTALADPLGTTSKLTKKEKKQVRAIATGVVDSLAAGLSVANAQTAGSATEAQSAVNAQQAQQAANAGTLDGQDSSDFLPADGVIRIPATEMVNNQFVQVADLPSVGIGFECSIDEGGEDRIDVDVTFSTTGSFLFAGAVAIGEPGSVFPVLVVTHPATGRDRLIQLPISVVSNEGTSLTGLILTGININGTTDRCFVGGHLVASG